MDPMLDQAVYVGMYVILDGWDSQILNVSKEDTEHETLNTLLR